MTSPFMSFRMPLGVRTSFPKDEKPYDSTVSAAPS
jgi:hypothetical protein